MNGLHTIQPAIPQPLLDAAIVLHHDHPGLNVRIDRINGTVEYRWNHDRTWTVYRALNPTGILYIPAHRIDAHRNAVLKETYA